jgi:nucleoside-diphosphate-sugar epimerase
MKLLITGYPGFFGRHVARAFKREGDKVRVLLHRRTVTIKEFSKEADECLWGSILEEEVVRNAVAGIDAVIHCAWIFHPASSERPTPNERGTELLLKESIQAGVKFFVFISSVAVYGMRKGGGAPLSESSPLSKGDDLRFIYPSEKIACENMLLSSDWEGMRIGIFRPGPLFDEKKGPMKKIVRLGSHGFAVGIGNGRNRMGFIHAKDVAEGIVKWVKSGQNGTIFNVTPTDHLRHKDWYRVWGKVHRYNMSPVFIRGFVIRLAAFGMECLKGVMRKPWRKDVDYPIATATRNIEYSNQALKEALGWNDKATLKYTKMIGRK